MCIIVINVNNGTTMRMGIMDDILIILFTRKVVQANVNVKLTKFVINSFKMWGCYT